MLTEGNEMQAMSCPIPAPSPRITMAHGGGGRLMHDLIDGIFLDGNIADSQHDGFVLKCDRGQMAFTTDSFVVRPLFFPGGDIGKLAVCGTVNDLAMCGAEPSALSAGFIIEEGFPLDDLRRIALSMRETARLCGVRIVTGDTKVVERGHGDGVYINTSGIGWVRDGVAVNPSQVCPGDAIILSGSLGRHGIALMAAREGLQFQSTIESDCAPLHTPVIGLLDAGIAVHCLRDLTRGGLASALVEIAESRRVRIHIKESTIPVDDDVHAACEVLGFDPLHVANEGCFCAFIPPESVGSALEVLRSHPVSADARVIGHVTAEQQGIVTLRTSIGTDRLVDMPSGELLPRIC